MTDSGRNLGKELQGSWCIEWVTNQPTLCLKLFYKLVEVTSWTILHHNVYATLLESWLKCSNKSTQHTLVMVDNMIIVSAITSRFKRLFKYLQTVILHDMFVIQLSHYIDFSDEHLFLLLIHVAEVHFFPYKYLPQLLKDSIHIFKKS